MRRTKQKKGITLVALIITIVILLILAVVTINTVSDDGIINKTKLAVDAYKESEFNESQKSQGFVTDIDQHFNYTVQGIWKWDSKSYTEGLEIKEKIKFELLDTDGYTLISSNEILITSDYYGDDGVYYQDQRGFYYTFPDDTKFIKFKDTAQKVSSEFYNYLTSNATQSKLYGTKWTFNENFSRG